MDKRLFDAQIKATEVQGLLAHIAKNVNYKQDLEEPATRNIDVINATLSEVCQMLEKTKPGTNKSVITKGNGKTY